MSLVSRLSQHLRTGFLPKPYVSFVSGTKPLNPTAWACRNYGQPARSEVVEEVEIDPRRLPADYDPAKFDPTCHRSPPSDRVFRLVDEVSSLTLREASELGSILMKKMGMTEAPVIGVLKGGAAAGLAQMGAQSAGAGAQVEKIPEKTVFELKLASFDTTCKLKVIKEIRAITSLGLKEAKDLVEKSPSVFMAGVSKDDADKLVEKLKAVGAVVVKE